MYILHFKKLIMRTMQFDPGTTVTFKILPHTESFYFLKGKVSRDGYFLRSKISTFYVGADGVQGLSKAFYHPVQL
jgi:hypothetical protein